MDEKIKEIFRVDKADDDRIPGTVPGDADKVIYVSLPPNVDRSNSYKAVIFALSPPVAKAGSAILENILIKTPNNDLFYAISFHDDLKGWQRQIEFGAHQLGLTIAKVKDHQLILSSGSVFPLSKCTITLK